MDGMASVVNVADDKMTHTAQTNISFGLGFLLLFLLLFFIFPSSLLAREPQNFIHSAYDPNLEVTFQGKVLRVHLPPKGHAVLEVEREGKSFFVFLCPVRYYYSINPEFKEGDMVEVTGAKRACKRYGISFMARHVKNLRTGALYLFRSPVPPYKPLWD